MNIETIANKIARYVPGCPLFERKDAVVQAIIDLSVASEYYRHSFQYTASDAEIDDHRNGSISISSPYPKKKVYDLKKLFISGVERRFARHSIKDGIDEADFDTIFQSNVKYYDLPEPNKIRIFPFDTDTDEFDDNGNINVVIDAVFVPLDTITTIDDTIYNDWKSAIESGAASSLLEIPGQQWTDMDLAGYHANKFEIGRNKILMRRNSQESGGNLRVENRMFL